MKVGIDTERGPWVAALAAAGYEVFPVNPLSVARYRERHSTSGAKSDAADAHLLAEIVRVDRAHHRPVAGDSPQAEAVKLVARAHQGLIWDRSRQVLRSGMAPITRASGRRKIVLARYARNRRLADALHQWAFCAMRGSPGAKAYYQAMRDRGIGHQAALRQLANRLVGVLHGCLTARTAYDEHTAWSHHQQSAARHSRTWDVCRDSHARRRDQLCGGANECTRAASSRSGLMCLPYRGPQGVAARRMASGSKSGAEAPSR